MIALEDDGTPVDPQYAAPLAAIIIEWSRIELGIETDLDDMRRYPVAANLAPEIPRGFNMKIKLWRRSVRALYPTIEAYQMVADMVRDHACDLAPKRNHLIHGQWAIEGPNNEGRWTVRNFKGTRKGYFVYKSEVTPETLSGTLKAIRKLTGMITGFTASKLLHAQRGLLQLPSCA
jgi:hypothetical protein